MKKLAAGSRCVAMLSIILAGLGSDVSLVDAADPTAFSVLIVYHSATGNTEKMAQGVADGARTVTGASVAVKRVADVAVNDLLSSDAVIVGSPVYFGSMSGEVKAFFDNWSLKFDVFRERK